MATASSQCIISATWLYEHLNDPDMAIVDCRFALADPNLGRQHYQHGHIPGAYYFDLNQDLSSPVQSHGGRHPLPDPTQLATKLAAAGIRSRQDSTQDSTQDATFVVVYDDSRLAFASRLWWLLRYYGHDRVAVLDGGWSAWQAAGYPVTTDRPAAKLASFIPQLQVDWVVDIDTVKIRKELPGVVLVDSREAERYRGEREPIDPVAGHIPGAVNYPWQDVTNDQGYARSPAEQQQRWNSVRSADEVIVYCGSGVTACTNLLSLEMAGISSNRLYVGSWSDWCSYL